jgi:hypothetical protein
VKRWLVAAWLLPAVLCAQELSGAGPESEPAPEPESAPKARVIAYPKEVPALANYEQGTAQTSDVPSAALRADAPLSSSVAATEPLKVLPGRTGYAFDQPKILLRQRLFGLAHGVSLLAAACVELPEQSVATQASFLAWHDQQAVTIVQLVHDLAGYYFGPQAATAQWRDLIRALQLKDRIDQSLGQFELSVACASLSQAITGPRYDLATLLKMEPLIAMKVIAGEFVPAGVAASAADGAADSATSVQSPLVNNAISAVPTVPMEEKTLSDEPAKLDELAKPHAP